MLFRGRTVEAFSVGFKAMSDTKRAQAAGTNDPLIVTQRLDNDAVSAGTFSTGLIMPVDILLRGFWTTAQAVIVASAADGVENGRHLAFGYAVTRSQG